MDSGQGFTSFVQEERNLSIRKKKENPLYNPGWERDYVSHIPNSTDSKRLKAIYGSSVCYTTHFWTGSMWT